MKKTFVGLFLCLALILGVSSQTPPQQPKPEDFLKNLVLVDKPEPAPGPMKAGFDTITARDSITLLTQISSDLMEGRETATRGYALAAEYAASLFKLWNVKPGGDTPSPRMNSFRDMVQPAAPPERSYLQEFALKEITDVQGQIVVQTRKGEAVKSRTFQSGIDYNSFTSTAETIAAPVVFAGYGIVEKSIGWDDFKGLDVKGKIVLVLSDAPGKDDPKSPFQAKELKEKYFPPAGPFGVRMGGFNKAAEIAKLGAVAVLQVTPGKDSALFKDLAAPRKPSDERPITNEPRRRLLIPGTGRQMPWEGSPAITITREMADAVLDASGRKIDELEKSIVSSYKPASMPLPGTTVTLATTAKAALVQCRNVVGYVEGSDPALKNEVVVVGAHFDHLGKRGDYVFNGADDNGSGSVGVMNIARAFAALAQAPKRTVVFCLWTGEEEGLLGSRYYVQNPAFPIEKTVAYLNMDMISRAYDEKTLARMGRMFGMPADQDSLKKINPANFVTASFSADPAMSEILRKANGYVGLDLFLRESKAGERAMGGSDHSSFGAVKVPWAYCMAGMTEDYHQTSDSVEKVSGELIAKVSKLLYAVGYQIADK